jgi:hypothetical protein
MDELFEVYLAVYEAEEFKFRPERSGPKPSVKPKSRERDIGKHNDWKDKPSEEWSERPPAALKLRRRAKAVTDTQRREDQEVKLRKEELEYIIDILVSEGYADNYDSAVCILEAMSDEWLVGILDEKYVKAMDPPKDRKRKGPDHRTSFAWLDPRQLGQNRNDPNREMDPEFFRTRLRQNDKKIDPYYKGNRKRRKERDRVRGGFNS